MGRLIREINRHAHRILFGFMAGGWLIASRTGPQFVGILRGLLRESYGDESLRYGVMIF